MPVVNVNISKKVFNPTYLPLINEDARYLVLFGGAGSGKSYAIAERYIIKLMNQKRCNLLVIRNTARSNRDSTFALLTQVIHNWNLEQLFTINKGDLRIKCANDNEVIFSGLDDVEKLKSVTFARGELTDIWVEEASEVLEQDFNQLDVRLRGGSTKKQICISFNPVDINHWLKKRFIDTKSDNIVVHHSTYKDNLFLDDDYKTLLESYKNTDPYYYDVYCCGNWGVLGKTIFDAKLISERLKFLREREGNPPGQKFVSKGFFDINGIWIDDPNGYISIYKKPTSNDKYVCGGDTAGEGSDFFIGQVLNAKTGEQVAVLRQQMDADLYAKQIYWLGKYYNYALLTIEVNFDTHPIRVLEDLGYDYQWVRESQDTFTGAIKKAHGFRTDAISRPRIISQMVQFVREYIDNFNDIPTLEECLTFVRNEKGRPEAQVGAHDDLIMAFAIAIEGMSQVIFNTIDDNEEQDSEEMFFDYGI